MTSLHCLTGEADVVRLSDGATKMNFRIRTEKFVGADEAPMFSPRKSQETRMKLALIGAAAVIALASVTPRLRKPLHRWQLLSKQLA
jgi:hypothetical protein